MTKITKSQYLNPKQYPVYQAQNIKHLILNLRFVILDLFRICYLEFRILSDQKERTRG